MAHNPFNLLMASPHQHLVILWKWRHLETPNADVHQALPVHGAKRKQVLHQLHQRGKSDLLPLLQQLMRESATGEYLLMLHQSAFGEASLRELLSALPNYSYLHTHFFGGGSDYLYYDSECDTGLLGQNGELAHRKYFGGVRGPDMLIDDELDPIRFRQVWRHYFYQCKRSLFDLREDILSHLIGSVLLQNQTGPTQTLLKTTHPNLFDRLQKALQITAEQYTEEENNISQALTHLTSFIEKQEISNSNHLRELNIRFSTLLNSIREPSY